MKMPDVVMHTAFGQDVLRRLSPETRERILPEPYRFALYGPDPWFAYKFWVHREGRGRRMHTTRTGAFLTALAEQAKTGTARREMFSYLAGFLCHYALDATTHPYIIRRTTTEFTQARAHMGFEHELDALQIARDGHAGERHAVTKYYFRPVQLPKSMDADLNRVYEKIYGWKDCRRKLNRSMRLFRAFFRAMESPGGVPARLARLRHDDGMKNMTYSENDFRGRDVENNAHAEWAHSHDDHLLSRESFGELRKKAEDRAVRLIEAAGRYIFDGEGSLQELSETIGNDSYLSGLPVDDPRCLLVQSMLPPADAAESMDGSIAKQGGTSESVPQEQR